MRRWDRDRAALRANARTTQDWRLNGLRFCEVCGADTAERRIVGTTSVPCCEAHASIPVVTSILLNGRSVIEFNEGGLDAQLAETR